jgi:hypothetical protein
MAARNWPETALVKQPIMRHNGYLFVQRNPLVEVSVSSRDLSRGTSNRTLSESPMRSESGSSTRRWRTSAWDARWLSAAIPGRLRRPIGISQRFGATRLGHTHPESGQGGILKTQAARRRRLKSRLAISPRNAAGFQNPDSKEHHNPGRPHPT